MSGFCYIPGGSLILNPWLHSQKLDTFDPPKGLAPIQTGDPPKMASEWPLGFSKRRKRTQNFLTFCYLPVSCSSLLSPSDFLDELYANFYIHMISRKGF